MGKQKKGKKSPEKREQQQKTQLAKFFQRRSVSCSDVQREAQHRAPSCRPPSPTQHANSQSPAGRGATMEVLPQQKHASRVSKHLFSQPEPLLHETSPSWDSGDDWQLMSASLPQPAMPDGGAEEALHPTASIPSFTTSPSDGIVRGPVCNSPGVQSTLSSDHAAQHNATGPHPLVDMELRSHILSLPSRQDIVALISHTELTLKSEISAVHTELLQLGERYGVLEKSVSANTIGIKHVAKDVAHFESRLTHLQNMLDDQENRSRRNNVRIKGLPESIKEAIMIKARERGDMEYEGSTVRFYQDLSRNTLRQRRLLKPIMDLLKERSIRYKWGYPFALIVVSNGKSYSVRSPRDIPQFMDGLDLPHIDVPECDSWDWIPPTRAPQKGQNSLQRSTRGNTPRSGQSTPTKKRFLNT
ncbi:hypothetical protein XELAEV_18004364mg [Xenopus laevis]|uniref:Uncharacterized protein n=1 Tax=Xenopus laevis TaxID=8355 RepID=A0A974BRC5_XENLA|nr:hypothetical protein XELAEV_18004364mg [Xenopus laevis]